MVKVLPPPGWKPTPELEQGFSAEDLAKVGAFASSGNFEDIEDVLPGAALSSAAQRPVASPAPKSKLPTTAPRPQDRKRPAKNPVESAEPILPTAQWTTSQSQQRRKWLLIGVSVLGAVIILGSIFYAFVINRNPTPVILNNDREVDVAALEPAEPPTEKTPADPVVPELPAPKTETNDQPADENPPVAVASDPPTTSIPDENPADVLPANPPEIPGSNAVPQLPVNPLVANPTEPTSANPVDDLINRDVFGNPIEDDSKLGKLSALLSQSNTSIREIQDLADSVRDTETIGISKYYVAKPDPLEEAIETDKRLGLSCAGILYDDLPLLAMLRDVTAITGVPFSLDAESFRAVDFDFGVRVSIKMEQSDDRSVSFATAIESVLAPLNVEQTTSPSGCVIVRPVNASVKTSTSYPLPAFAAKDDLAPKMVDFIKRMIAPSSWNAEGDPARIEIGTNELTVYQSPVIQRQIREFLEKLTFVSEFQGTPSELSKQAPLRTRWNSAQELLAQPLELGRTFDVPLESVCSTIQQKSGLTVLIDWPSIMQEGWTSATMVPGNIDEASVYRTIKEIARSMKITLLAVDAKTVELTTFQSAAAQLELEVYYYGDIIEETLTEEHVIDVVTRTLSHEFNSHPDVHMDFVPQLKCIIAVAPQSLQRQLEIVIERLRKL
jgi:hypothetical protein